MPAQPPTNPPPGPYGHRPQPPQHGGSGQPPQYGGGQQPPHSGGQQPPYPGGPQPSPFGSPPPPPKKKNTGLIIGLVGGGLVLVLIVVGMLALGVFGFFAFKKDPVAEPAPATSSPDSKPAPLPENTEDPNDSGSQDGDAPPPGSDIATSLGQLKAGDCVINLSTAGPPATVPCSEPHVHQIFSVGRTTDQSDNYPGYSALSRDGESYCKSARFELDTDRAVADDLKMVFFTPNATGWKDPDNRRIVCAVQRKDGSKMSEDYSKTA